MRGIKRSIQTMQVRQQWSGKTRQAEASTEGMSQQSGPDLIPAPLPAEAEPSPTWLPMP